MRALGLALALLFACGAAQAQQRTTETKRPDAAREVLKPVPKGRVARCSAAPKCSSGEICRSVSQTFAGDNAMASGRSEITRMCQQANTGNRCCAQRCAASVRCQPK